jgi:hypothetical protein
VPADPLDTLVASYPAALAERSGNSLIFRDGTRMDAGIADGRSLSELLSHATIRDQFLLPYHRGAAGPQPVNDDPGRFRNSAFFDKLYGDCRKGEVDKNLVSVIWLPKSWGKPIRVTRLNGVAAALENVSAEIDALPPDLKRASWPVAGAYACRGVADEGQSSMHAYGAAIDLNLSWSDYWLWESGRSGRIIYRNRIPKTIVDIFERHGFIWGGRWYHYDTMHFEYRPELLR